jgi:hypothetical protein
VICTRCKVDKPLDRFSLRKAGDPAGGYRMPCKDCVNAAKRTPEGRRRGVLAARKYNAANRERVRLQRWARDLWQRFRMTLDDYEAQADEQGGLCLICRRPCPQGRLSVDHDRSCCPGDESCGECVRELLCRRCNLGLGAFDDRPDLLRAAAEYLEGHVLIVCPVCGWSGRTFVEYVDELPLCGVGQGDGQPCLTPLVLRSSLSPTMSSQC